MSQNIAAYKTVLDEERAALMHELHEIGVPIQSETGTRWEPKVVDVDAVRSDASDVADRLESFSGNTALVRRLTKRINEIDMALEKIQHNEDEFGKCRICGKEIEQDRLQANPAATTCKTHMNQ